MKTRTDKYLDKMGFEHQVITVYKLRASKGDKHVTSQRHWESKAEASLALKEYIEKNKLIKEA
jgi:hypothetical protein